MQDLLEQALKLHQQGKLEEAAGIYISILQEDPQHADAMHLLGVAAHQKGAHEKAVELIQQAIAVQPTSADFHSNLAEALRAVGQDSESRDAAAAALRLDPGSIGAWNSLGLAQLGLGEVEDAEGSFREAVRIDPTFVMAWNNLGNALRQQDRVDEAIEVWRRAVELKPDFAQGHNNLGQLLLEELQPEEALQHCERAVELSPSFAEAQSNLGNTLRALNRIDEAKQRYEVAMQLNPSLGMVYNNMGQALQEEGNLDDAIGWYLQALSHEPRSARFHTNLASVFAELDRNDEAHDRYRMAIECDPGWPEAHNGLGQLCREEENYDEAAGFFREAIRLKPRYTAAHSNLGHVHEELGESDAARACYREALRHSDRCVGALNQLAIHHRDELTNVERDLLFRLLGNECLSPADRASLNYAAASLFDSEGTFAEAGRHLEVAVAAQKENLIRRGKTYEAAEHTLFVDRLIEKFDCDFFRRVFPGSDQPAWGSGSEEPVFVIGLPRSGTTLTEQILASHPDVHGAGELSLAGNSFDGLPESWGRDEAAASAQVHLERLRELGGSAARVVDKLPDNYLYLGWIVTLFPRARVIYCQRDLRDVAVSCLMTQFKSIRWACDLADIERRFVDHIRLMNHWREVLPSTWYEVRYERTVEDTEQVARELINWLGLDWDDRCLEFHRTRRPVRTASVSQVRQPVHSRSVARWQRYEPFFGECFQRLDGLLAASSSPTRE